MFDSSSKNNRFLARVTALVEGTQSERVARGAAPAVDHLGVRGAAGQCCQQQYYWIKCSPSIDLIYKVSSCTL